MTGGATQALFAPCKGRRSPRVSARAGHGADPWSEAAASAPPELAEGGLLRVARVAGSPFVSLYRALLCKLRLFASVRRRLLTKE